MIDWQLIAYGYNSDETVLNLMDKTSITHEIRETDFIKFRVCISNDKHNALGSPYVIIGDIPIELEPESIMDNSIVFASQEQRSHTSRYFYNFFGESEIALSFEKSTDIVKTCKINILARLENAKLAGEMLDYITSNLEDAVAICFSRSKISSGYNSESTFPFSRLDIIEKAINYISANLSLFLRVHKYTWKSEMQFSENGQPIGPDSVYWVLSNLDRISPASLTDANLIYKNRSYRLDLIPKEGLIDECDVFENRVIHTFLHGATQFIFELKSLFTSSLHSNQEQVDKDFVRFDHTMQKFAHLALKQKLKSLDQLSVSVEKIRRIFLKKIPARIVPGIQPKMSAFVAKNQHYNHAFRLIEQCIAAPAPSFEGENILLGLKNLSIIYEISTLLMLTDSIKRCFSAELIESSFRYQSKDTPFGGEEMDRPSGGINNFFSFHSNIFDIELYYEPRIFTFSDSSSIGDLVDTSDSRSNRIYGRHYFCPDFVMKISSINWKKPIIVILDAKYKDAETIKKFDIQSLTQKYLLNIHQVNARGYLGLSPVQLLLILFPHDRNGKHIHTVAPIHCLSGNSPVLPQVAGLLLKPSSTSHLDEHFKSLIELMDKEYH